MAFLVFYITHPDEETARSVANHLVERRLAACANIFPITSSYWWQEALQQEREWVSIIKTRIGLEQQLEAEVQKIHPYEVPCLMRLEVRANAAYEAWIEASTLAP